MSKTSLVGSLGYSRQTAKDTAGTTFTYRPTTSVNLNPNQQVQPLPPEIGGDYFVRAAYKTSVSGGGDVSYVVRPNSLGDTLYALCGQDTVTPVAGQTGAYDHLFAPFVPTPGVDLPWYTLQKDISKIANVAGDKTLAEQYMNAKLRSLRLDVPKSAIVTAQESWLATTPSSVDGTAFTGLVFDSTPFFQTCSATIKLTKEGDTVNISNNSVKVERLSMNYTNQLSEDEFSVGNFFLEDITLLQRQVQVEMDFVVRDSALYQAVYQNGGAIGTSWSPTVYRGALTVTLTSGAINIPTTTTPYQLILTFPGLDFMMMPIQLQGADLVRANLSTQVSLGPTGAARFTAKLTNGVASY